MSNKILLSICIPTYNRADYLKKCLESVVSQDAFNCNDIEVLISDNASKDATERVARSFQGRFKNIRYIKNNINLDVERNILNLLNNFQGDYFFLLCDDNILLSGSLKILKKAIINNPDCSLFLSGYENYFEKQKRIGIHQAFNESKKISKDNISDLVKIYYDSHLLSRMCLKRDFIDVEGFKRHIGSLYSHMYLVGFAALNGTTYFIKELLNRNMTENKYYWIYPDGQMMKARIKLLKDLRKFNKDFYERAKEKLITTIPGIVYASISKSYKNFLKLNLEILSIPELRFNPKVWFLIVYGIGMKVYGFLLHQLIIKK